MKKAFLFISVSLFVCSIHAQDIFKEHGFEKETLTLSKGKYKEVFSNDEVVQIGSVLLNTKTNKIVEFLDEEIEVSSFKAEHSSRFLTIDPLAEKYYSISPYAYCNNNPIMYIDPTGMDYELSFANDEVKKYFEQIMNKQLEGQFTVDLKKNDSGTYTLGFTATKNGGNLSEMSEKGQAFYSEMKKGIDDHTTTANLTIVSGSSTPTGDYATGKVDIADIAQFPFERGYGATQAGKIAHEFTEQFGKAELLKTSAEMFKGNPGYGYTGNHRKGIISENKINDNNRSERDSYVNRNTAVQEFTDRNGKVFRVAVNSSGGIIKVTVRSNDRVLYQK